MNLITQNTQNNIYTDYVEEQIKENINITRDTKSKKSNSINDLSPLDYNIDYNNSMKEKDIIIRHDLQRDVTLCKDDKYCKINFEEVSKETDINKYIKDYLIDCECVTCMKSS